MDNIKSKLLNTARKNWGCTSLLVIFLAFGILGALPGMIYNVNVSSIEDGREDVIGEWQAVEDNDEWTRIIFYENGEYELWSTMKADRKWGEVKKVDRYEILESTYSDTGEEYVYAQLDNSGICNYKVILSGWSNQLVCGSHFTYVKKTTSNPW